MEGWGFLTLVLAAPRLADLYHTGGRRPKQNSPGRCLPLAPHVPLAHLKLQQNKQLTTGIPLSAARRLPAGKISRKPRGRGAEGGSAAPASLSQVGAAVTRGRREVPPRGLLSLFPDGCVSARQAAAPFRLPRRLRYLGEGA